MMVSLIYIILVVCIGILFFLEMRRSLQRSTITNRLITNYLESPDEKVLIDQIYQYCMKDYKLRHIMIRYQAKQEDLYALHKKLLLWGNFKKGRRFVPISSFFFTSSLEYLLKHKDGDAKKLTMHMMNFFHI